MRTFILNGNIIDPASGTSGLRDVLIEDGRIASVAEKGQLGKTGDATHQALRVDA